ncbi:MAG: membrane protein insertase YidC [Thermodesulfobacteriota bacterium]|nr:membrane protein insertase YidC [Thermodesulfobacteriota bacterium]
MEKRALLAIILSFLVLYFYYSFFAPEPEYLKEKKQKIIKEAPEKKKEIKSFKASVPFIQKKLSGYLDKEIEVENDLYHATFTTRGGGIKYFTLKKYKENLNQASPLINLIESQDNEEEIPAFSTAFTGKDFKLYPLDYKVNVNSPLKITSREELIFTGDSYPANIIKKFIFYPENYKIDMEWEITNKGDYPLNGLLNLHLHYNEKDKEGNKSGYFQNVPSLIVLQNKKIIKEELAKLHERYFYDKIFWAGFEDKYFLQAVIPNEFHTIKFNKESTNKFVANFGLTELEISPGKTLKKSYSIYLGPKDLDFLNKAKLQLEKSLNFGWFDAIAKPLLVFLKWLNKITGNFGMDIIILTVVIKVIFLPLTHKSMHSMKEMQKIQPKINAIKEKYKDNKEGLNKEIIELYRTNKVNPLGGCLPMLLQIPVFFALYKVLLDSIELRHAPFILWINDLSAKDPYYITPILMGISMFIQQKMTPQVGDPTQAKLMLILPVIFTFMFLNFPSGLVIYWLVNNLLSIVQQFYINKYQVK